MSEPLEAKDDRECVSGTAMAGKAEGCRGCPNADACSSGATTSGPDPDVKEVEERMAHVKNKILVLSGKGGVGKSTFSTMLSFALAEDEDVNVGLMDIDICGPSIPRMAGVMGADIKSTPAKGWEPVYVTGNLGVISVGFLLQDEDAAVIWRGPRKNGLIKQFLRDVDWGELDYLVIDTPPGTSDEHLSVAQYLKNCNIAGAVVVTTPQEVALLDVRKEISFCKKTGIPVLGVVENMSGFVCPNCKNPSQIFRATTGGAAAMCEEMKVPFLGAVPLDPALARSCDEGKDFLKEHAASPAAKALRECVQKIRSAIDEKKKE